MQAFELQTHRDGKWKTDMHLDDRELALFEARKFDDSRRYSRIRVIEEISHEDRELTEVRTIFRGGNAHNDNANPQASVPKAPDAKTPGRSSPRGAAGKKPPGRGRARSKPKTLKFRTLSVLLLVILVGGLAALFGLQHLILLG